MQSGTDGGADSVLPAPGQRGGPVWGIVVAGGSGRRFGGPKQFELLAGSRVVDRSVAVCADSADGVVLVVPADRTDGHYPRATAVVAGGETRSASVRAGLAAVPREAEVIVVHDAARPLATAAVFADVVAAVRAGADAAVPGVAAADTIKRTATDSRGVRHVTETVERADLSCVQTPQAFAAEVLRRAHRSEPDATDDAGLVEAAGGDVVVVDGDPSNFKLTEPSDFARAEPMVRGSSWGERGIRTGFGFDVHPFGGADRPLVLGGVVMEAERGLAGHSDADVVCHAIADAMLGAAGLGDLGNHFPDDDPAYAGADSTLLLGSVVASVRDAGWVCMNGDVTVVLEAPRLAPVRLSMQERLSGILGAPVSVKATRAEGLGAIGRGEGIMCWASVLLAPVDGI